VLQQGNNKQELDMSMLMELADGLKVIAEHFPFAISGADHDKIMVCANDMTLEYWEEKYPKVWAVLQDWGFRWDYEDSSIFYFT
jgi:hypothetical protein